MPSHQSLERGRIALSQQLQRNLAFYAIFVQTHRFSAVSGNYP
jgi:hypothetical protein